MSARTLRFSWISTLKKLQVIEPVAKDEAAYKEAYKRWLTYLP